MYNHITRKLLILLRKIHIAFTPSTSSLDSFPRLSSECNCNNHAAMCHFDQRVYEATGFVSGGVCDDCAHNTEGRNCEQCVPYYYQDPERELYDPEICQRKSSVLAVKKMLCWWWSWLLACGLYVLQVRKRKELIFESRSFDMC